MMQLRTHRRSARHSFELFGWFRVDPGLGNYRIAFRAVQLERRMGEDLKSRRSRGTSHSIWLLLRIRSHTRRLQKEASKNQSDHCSRNRKPVKLQDPGGEKGRQISSRRLQRR